MTLPLPSRWRALLAPAVLVLAVAAAYSNSLHGEFVFDDFGAIPRNPSIRQLWPLTDVLFPDDPVVRTTTARPILNLSLAINYALHGLQVEGYHLANLLIHACATLTLYGVVRRTLMLDRWGENLRQRAGSLSFVCALLWGLHPLQTESVTYLIQRAESLAGLLYLLTLYASVRAHNSRWPALWYAVAIVACLLGVGVKEIVATAPLAVLLYDRVFLFANAREMFRRRSAFYAGLAASWLAAAVLILGGKGRGGIVGFGYGMSPIDYLTTQFWAIAHYLRLSLFPYPLVLDYGNELITEPRRFAWGAILVMSLFLGTLAAFRWQPWIGFLGCCFFLILAPSSSFIPVTTQTIAEHRMYLPLAAVAVLLVMVADSAWRSLQSKRSAAGEKPLPAWVPALAAMLAGILLAMVTFQRNFDYRTRDSIWQDTQAKRPGNARSRLAMARIHLDAGNKDAALRELEAAARLISTTAADYYNMGTVLLQLDRPADAIKHFDQALAIDSYDAATWHNRGMCRQKLGQHEQAISDFTEALDRDPRLAVAYLSRSISYQALGDEFKEKNDRDVYQALSEL